MAIDVEQLIQKVQQLELQNRMLSAQLDKITRLANENDAQRFREMILKNRHFLSRSDPEYERLQNAGKGSQVEVEKEKSVELSAELSYPNGATLHFKPKATVELEPAKTKGG